MSGRRVPARRGVIVVALVSLVALGLAGCGGPKVHPVRGKVVLADGDASQLAGKHVEFELEGDPNVRADGLIDEAGRFELQTMHQGKLYKGALEGKYRARIILTDEDGGDEDDRPKRKRRKQQPVHERFLNFDTSGLTYQVPADGEITVNVSAK